MKDTENPFFHNFDQIDEVIREILLKWEIELECFKHFDLKTVNFILTSYF